jgi:transcriptional regulator with XRE-family HTH domain
MLLTVAKNNKRGKNMQQKRFKMIDLRAKKGWSQRQAAEATGTTKDYYGLLENGKRVGTVPFWVRFAKVYKLSNAELWEIAKEGVVVEGKTKLCK